MSETETTTAARRMSAEEAASKADALIAQHRAARSPTRGASRGEGTCHSGRSSRRNEVLALLVLGVVTGLTWRTAPLLAVGLGVAAVALAFRIVRGLPDDDASSGAKSR